MPPVAALSTHAATTSISRAELEADVLRAHADSATILAHLEGRNALETMLARTDARRRPSRFEPA